MYKYLPYGDILRQTDNASIPRDERNADYQRYLAWLDAGNQPEPADPLPEPPPAKNDVLLELLGTMSPTEPDLELIWLVLTESLRS